MLALPRLRRTAPGPTPRAGSGGPSLEVTPPNWHGPQNPAPQRWLGKPAPESSCQALHEKALFQGTFCPQGWAQESSGTTDLHWSQPTYWLTEPRLLQLLPLSL